MGGQNGLCPLPPMGTVLAAESEMRWRAFSSTWMMAAPGSSTPILSSASTRFPARGCLTRWRDALGDTNAAELVAQYLGWTKRDYRSQIGIPQGSVLAPWLCNIFLWQLDDHVADIGDALVRYADDFVIQVNSEARARHVHDDCEAFLRSLQLRLHPSKTRVVGGGERFRFLGRWLRTARPSALRLLWRRMVNVARYR